MIKIKRAYDPAANDDGKRVLVDRFWPRGLTKEKALIDAWLKDIAPSNELRKWYSHDPAKWEEFKKRYRDELKDKKDILAGLKSESEKRTITLIYSSRETRLNNAEALKELISGKNK